MTVTGWAIAVRMRVEVRKGRERRIVCCLVGFGSLLGFCERWKGECSVDNVSAEEGLWC